MNELKDEWAGPITPPAVFEERESKSMTFKPSVFALRYLLLGLLCGLTSCSTEPPDLEGLGVEGVQIEKRVTVTSAPEIKLQTARDLLMHASQYDRLLNRSSPEIQKARRFQRQEQHTSAMFMQEAAADYAKRLEYAKTRDVYNSILSSFPDEDFGLVREAAESSLKELDHIEKPAN